MYASFLLAVLVASFSICYAETTTGVIWDSVSQATDAGQQAFEAVQLFVDLFAVPEANGTMVTIGVNGESSNDRDYEGSVGIIWAFDVFNDVLGSSDVKPPRIGAGEKGSVEVHQELGPGIDAQYIDVIASDDEICISYIFTQTYGSDKAPYAWLGDIGKQCGQAWEFGATPVSGGDQVQYFPACVWLDKDHGDDIDKKGQSQTITNRQMKMNLHAYSGLNFTNGTRLEQDYVCESTIFTWNMDDPIADIPRRGPIHDPASGRLIEDADRKDRRRDLAVDKRAQRQTARPQSKKMAERLWVNSRPSQSAVELCSSPTSRGSDFLSINEGLFCDMSTKRLHPICTNNTTTGCFDLDTSMLQLRQRQGSAKLQQRARPFKQYKKITYSD